MSRHEIAIAGAGIGGLTAAFALGLKGFHVRVFERDDAPRRDGAGIQLGPNATRLLDRLGLMTAVAQDAVTPEAIAVSDGLSGKPIMDMPLGEAARTRYGAPYLVIHRGDLHTALWMAARSLDNVEIVTRTAVTGFTGHSDSVDIALAHQPATKAAALIGADGVWSEVRHGVIGDARPDFTGEVAWRGLAETQAFPVKGAGTRIGVWLAPGGHLVHYPVSGGRAINVVAIATGEDPGRGWSREVGAGQVSEAFERWAPLCREIIASVTGWRQWPVLDRAPDPCWTSGRVTLLGDAAHPMPPYLAQGGAMAIEDGYVLAECLDANRYRLPAGLKAYQAARMARTARVQAQSRANARHFHADGITRYMRNMVLKTAGGARMLARYDWLYGADAEAIDDAATSRKTL